VTEALLYRVAAGASAALGVAGAAAWLAPGARWRRPLWAGSAVALSSIVVVAWVLRWRVAGHLPIFGTYESALSLAVAVLLSALVWELRGRFEAGVTPFAALVAAGVLGQGLRYDATPFALTISERSWWVDVHAIVAWLAFGVLALNAAVAARMLAGRGEPAGRDGALVRTLELGFFLHSAMLASGSFYKFLLFGTAWTFDPIETLGFAAWLSYGTVLHLNLLAGWRARRLAGWCLLLFVVLVASYRLIVYFPAWATYHIFDISLRLHGPG
jgi:ABC-type transport system involved in cytochrome c biogenesis permease subunit